MNKPVDDSDSRSSARSTGRYEYCGACGESRPVLVDRVDIGVTFLRCTVCHRTVDVWYDDDAECQ